MTCPCTTAADIISTVATIQPGDACGFAGAQAAMARHGRLPSCCGTQKVGAAAKNPKPSYSRVIEMHIQALSRAGALSTPGKIRGDDEVRLLKASLAFFSEKKGRDSTGRQPDEGSLAAKFVALRDLAGAPVRLPKAALLVSTRIDQMVVASLPDDTTTIGTREARRVSRRTAALRRFPHSRSGTKQRLFGSFLRLRDRQAQVVEQ